MAKPSPAHLRQLLDYKPNSGKLYWKTRTGLHSKRWNTKHAGEEAGTYTPEGYVVMKVNGCNHGAHRIIWAMVYGCWPECVDHKNGKGTDNRLKNLRAVSRKINQRNQKRHSSNSSGITGVTWAKVPQKWLASIKVEGQSMHLGYFERIEDATVARKAAERKHHFSGRA